MAKMVSGIVRKAALGVIGIIVTFIVVFNLVGGTAGEVTDAAGNISGSGLPLASLFSSSGVLMIVYMIVIFVGLLVIAFKAFGGKN